jgi:hypothetical protein
MLSAFSRAREEARHQVAAAPAISFSQQWRCRDGFVPDQG